MPARFPIFASVLPLVPVFFWLPVASADESPGDPPNRFPEFLPFTGTPYVLSGELLLDNASTVVQAGVIVEFEEDAKVVLVNFTGLSFLGTEENPIILRGHEGARWQGIQLRYPSHDNATAANAHLFEWVRFEDAAIGYDVEFYEAGSQITFRHCTFVSSQGASRAFRIGSEDQERSGPYAVVLDQIRLSGGSGPIAGLGGTGLSVSGSRENQVSISGCFVDFWEIGIHLEGGVIAGDLAAWANGTGLETRHDPMVTGASLFQNGDGLRVGEVLGDKKPVFDGVQVLENTVGVRVGTTGDCRFKNGNLYGNSGHAVYLERACPAILTTVEFRECFWGLETTMEMKLKEDDITAIHDVHDDDSLCEVDYGGFLVGQTVGAPLGPASASGLRLAPPFPNPFRRSTRIEYELSRDGHVSLSVFDIAGRLVRVLEDAHRPLGSRSVTWDGMTRSGVRATAGVYFVRLTSDGRRQVTTATLLK